MPLLSRESALEARFPGNAMDTDLADETQHTNHKLMDPDRHPFVLWQHGR